MDQSRANMSTEGLVIVRTCCCGVTINFKAALRACVHKHLQVEVEVNYDSQCLSQEETSNPKKTSFTICSLNNSLSIFWVNFGLIQQLCHRVLFTTETKKRSEIAIMHASHWLLLHGNGGMLEGHSCGILIYLPYHNDRQNVMSQK